VTRRVRILAQASEEAVEAAAWYDAEQPGLGRDFQSALDAALDLLEGDVVPLTTMPGLAGRRGAKKLMLRRFPYDVVVVDRPDEYLVVAIAHQSRRPGYWRDRQRD
jgi:hypothetical protein